MASVTELVQYGIVFAVTLVFSMLALAIEAPEYKILTKIIAGTCWILMSVTQFIFMDVSSGLPLALAVVFASFSLVFYSATINDWFTFKKQKRSSMEIEGV